MLCYYGDDMEEYRRWEDNIKMDLKEIGVDVMNWMKLVADRASFKSHWSQKLLYLKIEISLEINV